MLYALDRIENNLGVLENLDTKELIEVPLSNLPSNVKEGSILKKEADTFALDLLAEEKRRLELRSRLDRLKNLNRSDSDE